MSVTERPRGRPREFDPQRALATIKEQFVEHGYHATTLSHLTAATGLYKGSLYAAFGDKHELFLAVLRYTSAETLSRLEETLASAPGPLEGVRAYVRGQAVCVADLTANGRGCLVANTTLELLPGDDEVKAVVRTHQRKMIDRLAAVVDLAKGAGELTSARPSQVIARYVFTVVEGLWQIARIDPDPDTLADVVEAALDGLR
ncbi:TetR/AcrR family transcriptional regulator [Tenggerimyces flavus]|uniref:TetR/AcrR family transcriptional regulator n=1 Tax=Tenggerimyces flavus TaxID=1708749 RepID=A0ABV7YEK9_9ACTN|nr:TetR/AcrR family transcriptional regulator [Tenggerimyces flavus]MBM7786832.1 TetR/AcrR family transcriptional repressor of nem operon [Tenggerimyces flavus]